MKTLEDIERRSMGQGAWDSGKTRWWVPVVFFLPYISWTGSWRGWQPLLSSWNHYIQGLFPLFPLAALEFQKLGSSLSSLSWAPSSSLGPFITGGAQGGETNNCTNFFSYNFLVEGSIGPGENPSFSSWFCNLQSLRHFTSTMVIEVWPLFWW